MSSSSQPNGGGAPSINVPTRVTTSRLRANSFRSDTVILSLDDQENQLFDTLVGTANAFESGLLKVLPNNIKPQHVEIRVAGGWVRDKILGLYSHDVDIAVDCLSGKDFATLVQAFLKQHQEQVGKMGVISANPSQSKHLETATMVVHGVEVDFTNLRAEEVYEAHSRIPTTTFGTALEDALRRDFTVNALFFNLRTKQVEDFTQRGIQDLRSGQIVTPLNPMTTFHDDPLRVLRAIRFAVRYDFNLHKDLEAACMSREVHQSLHVKVSRERVGKELEGMFSGKGAQPNKALDMIARLKLAGSVFCVPTHQPLCGTIMNNVYDGPHDALSHLRELGWEESRALLSLVPPVQEAHERAIIQQQEHTTLSAMITKVDTRFLHLAVFLLPFRFLTYMDRKDKVQTVVSYILREGIKFKNKDVIGITKLMETVDQMKKLITTAAMQKDEEPNHNNICRLDAGVLLRSTKELWVTSLLLATVAKLRETQQQHAATAGTTTTSSREQVLLLSQELYRSIVLMGLDRCWTMKPLLDGRAVIQALDLPKGPIVGTYLDEQVRWMLLNPNGSREDCERHLQQCKRNLEGQREEHNEVMVGVSDGVGPSSPLHSGKSDNKHYSKKMHVESMDLR